MIMPLSEIIGAALEAVEKTAEAGEAIEGAEEGISKLSELGNSFQELSEAQTDYLAELNVPKDEWVLLSSEQQVGHLKAIEGRLREMGLEYSKIDTEKVFDSHIQEAYEQKKSLEHIEPTEQYVSIEQYEKFCEDPEAASTLNLGQPKDADVLRDNMYKVQDYNGVRNTNIERSNSRAHHIVGDNPSTIEAENILGKYGIDINDPMNGVFLPSDVESPLKGVIHEGRHTNEYHDIVNQRLRMASSREDCLDILQSIKEDLVNGDLPLYKNHVVNY